MSEVKYLQQLTRSLLTGFPVSLQDPHRPHWHIAPSIGLMNDPNGWIQARGVYHLFYQWNPFACKHGAKWWGHLTSTDLVHWKNEPVALMPTESYEVSGCYSGSAVLHQDQIHLLYTGNVKYPDGSRTAYQCLAVEQADGLYEKQGPVIELPEGYSGHVRDPKVWFQDGFWWMVLAAQTLDLQGRVLLYQSTDLRNWTQKGEIAGSHVNQMSDFGYMWECPDLFQLNGQDILLCCPQGIPKAEGQYPNLYQCGYFIGQLDLWNIRFEHGDFIEIDHGFEFYAAQTTESEDGRRLLFGWLGLPDDNELSHPTIAYGWVDHMTCPRELTFENNKLYQRPVKELSALRIGDGISWQGIASDAPQLSAISAELWIDVTAPFRLSIRDAAWVIWDGSQLTFIRHNWRTQQSEQRHWRGSLHQLQLLFDASSIEIFINDGESCMSARYFPSPQKTRLEFDGAHPVAIRHWLFKAPMLECMQLHSPDVL